MARKKATQPAVAANTTDPKVVTDEQLAPIVEHLKAGNRNQAGMLFGTLCESIPDLPHWGILALRDRVMKAAGLIKPRPTKD